MDLKRPTHVIGLWTIATMAGQAITGFGVFQHRHRHQRVMRHQSGGGKNGRWVVDVEVLWWSVHGTAHCIEMQQNPLRPSYIPPLTACEWGVHGPPPGPPSPQPQNWTPQRVLKSRPRLSWSWEEASIETRDLECKSPDAGLRARSNKFGDLVE